MPDAYAERQRTADGRPPISPRPASPFRVARMSDWREQQRHRDQVRRDDVMSLAVLRVRHHGILDAPDVDVLVCASIGPAGEAVAVWTAPASLEAVTSTTVSAAGARFPDSAAARPVAARITVHTPNLASVIPIADLGLAHITVLPMPSPCPAASPAGSDRALHRQDPDPEKSRLSWTFALGAAGRLSQRFCADSAGPGAGIIGGTWGSCLRETQLA
jgi:hypothetical protein